MTDVAATTTGFFPRPDYVIEALKNEEGHQKEGLGDAEEKVEDTVKQGRKEVLEIQREAGIDLTTEGQLAWDDLLAFPATRLEGVEMGGIVRFYDNNRFYREPQVVDELRRTRPLTVDQYETAVRVTDKQVKPVMPGPYTLARMSQNEYYDSRDDYLTAIAEVVNEELRALDEAGANVIQLDEPSLTGVNEEDVETEAATEAISRATEGVTAETVVTTYFGDITEVYPNLLNVVDGVALDLVSGQDNHTALDEHGSPPILGAGIMNARNTRLESKEELVESVEDVMGRASPDALYVAPNCGLDFLPWTVMRDKVERLGEAVEEVS